MKMGNCQEYAHHVLIKRTNHITTMTLLYLVRKSIIPIKGFIHRKSKYAPELTEDEYKESLSGMERSEYKIDYDSYEYSPNIKNDTNIGFNGLELMSEMGVSSGGDALDNILYYTEWVGLRERNMLMNAKRKERTLVYKYDERGNIVKMIYRYGENMRKHRVDMEKDLFTISIEYVE